MQSFVLFWIALCLVVDTSTKSVTNTEDETEIGNLTFHSHWNADDNPTAEECKCENGFCEMDANGNMDCKCPTEWGLYTPTSCRKCDCGKGSNCTFSGLIFKSKVCICKSGYKEDSGSCRDVCSPNPCRNAGVCNVTRKGVICQCKERFRGPDCSIEIPLIATSTSVQTTNITRISTILPTSNPFNHSLNFTIARSSTLGLTTIEPTTGKDPCTESPCQNGGTCVTVGNTRKCLCKKPYLGNVCETDPCDWNPCKNGGVCKIEYETVRCFCREPFTGEFCESRIRIDTYVITLVAGSVILTAILTFVTCILCQRYHVMRGRSECS